MPTGSVCATTTPTGTTKTWNTTLLLSRPPTRRDLPGLISALRVPVLVIAAPVVGSSFLIEGGSALRGKDREAVRALVPEDRFMELDGGHSLHRDQSESIAALIGSFARSLS
jgi:hypothetical protein